MNPTVQDVAGEAYSFPKIMELLSVPAYAQRHYKLEPIGANGSHALLRLSHTRLAKPGEAKLNRNWESELGDRMRALLTAWPECSYGNTWVTYKDTLATEHVSFSVPRPRWDDKVSRTWVHANQGWRPGEVLAFRMTPDGMERLVEYTMPKGSTALRIEGPNGDRSVSYKQCPKAFLQYMQKAGIEWVGDSQTGMVEVPWKVGSQT